MKNSIHHTSDIRHIVLVILSLFTFHFSLCYANIGMQELGDSLTAYTGFSPVWSPAVKVKNLRVSGNNVTVRTNLVLKDVRWTPGNVSEIKRKVSYWVLGHSKGKVTIIAGRTPIEDLITDCAKSFNRQSPITNGKADLTDRQIALYPSHGLYFNRDREEWIWQRATLWTTVEDLYSQEYVRQIKQMLENAGATVLMPRAGLDDAQPGLSGMPRWTEGARAWLVSQHADSTLWDLYDGNEYKDDMKCRAMWINAQTAPVDLCVAFHTDGLDSGDDSTIVGTLVIYTARDDDGNTRLRNGKDRERTNRNLADWLQTQVTEDLRHIAPEWTRRQLKEANYCETRVPVVPSIILELLSHKNMADMRYGLDPKFRFAASRAVYKGILRYLNGYSTIVQPLPVKDLGITNLQSSIFNLQWKVPIDSLEPSAKPSYYMVYSRENDGEWNVQQVENDTVLALSLQPGIRYDYYVVAGNEGGLSFPSPIVSAYLNDSINRPIVNRPIVNIVDAFNDVYGPEWFTDSLYAGIVPGSYACEDGISCAYIGEQWNFTRTDAWINDDNCGWGSCYRDHAGQLTIGNTHDYTVLHGRVLQQMGLSYISCTAGFLTGAAGLSVKRSDSEAVYQAQPVLLDIICGRNRVPLDTNCQLSIVNYLASGGRLLLSSDHLSALNPAWLKANLHASSYASQATRSGKVQLRYEDAPKRPFTVLLSPNDSQLFTDHAEGLKPTDTTAIRFATYMDMRVPAAVGYKSSMTNDQSPITLVYGFPLETTTDFDRLYRLSIEWLLREEK